MWVRGSYTRVAVGELVKGEPRSGSKSDECPGGLAGPRQYSSAPCKFITRALDCCMVLGSVSGSANRFGLLSEVLFRALGKGYEGDLGSFLLK
jgi:hypothetical protein